MRFIHGKLSYPKLEKNQRINVTNDEISYWKKLRREGMSIKKISDMANRDKTVVVYHITPYGKSMHKKGSKRYMEKTYEKRWKQYYREKNKLHQRERYKNDLDYRIYQTLSKHGFDGLKKKYGTFQNYYNYRKALFEKEKEPSITKEKLKTIVQVLRMKFKVEKHSNS